MSTVKRWRPSQWKNGSLEPGRFVERPDIDAFLAEVIAVCERRGLGLSHEDGHGSFEVVDLAAFSRDWLMNASDQTSALPDGE